ncbi:MAG: energy transducer TonB [Bacteroidota bacterium]
MKKSILIIASAVCIYSFSSCKSKDESESSAVTGTDSSMMTTPTTTESGLPSTVKPDSIINPGVTDTTAAKPDPTKKGKKGKVTLNMDEARGMGNAEEMDKEGYYTNVYPVFPGGNKALANFFEKNIEYPQEASDNGMEGTVIMSFTVDEKGKIGSPKVTSPKLGYGIEEEAIRVFKKMPSWAPGSLKGKNVKTRYTLPVRFQLES